MCIRDRDIYDLSEQIGKEVLTNILNSISRPENVLEKPDVLSLIHISDQKP